MLISYSSQDIFCPPRILVHIKRWCLCAISIFRGSARVGEGDFKTKSVQNRHRSSVYSQGKWNNFSFPFFMDGQKYVWFRGFTIPCSFRHVIRGFPRLGFRKPLRPRGKQNDKCPIPSPLVTGYLYLTKPRSLEMLNISWPDSASDKTSHINNNYYWNLCLHYLSMTFSQGKWPRIRKHLLKILWE